MCYRIAYILNAEKLTKKAIVKTHKKAIVVLTITESINIIEVFVFCITNNHESVAERSTATATAGGYI